jgi:hypothetical protein
MLTALVLLSSIGTTDCRNIVEAPTNRGCLYLPPIGMEEAAKHPVLEGKYVKLQCVHKSVPRIIEESQPGLAS